MLYTLDATGQPQPISSFMSWAIWMEAADVHLGKDEVDGVLVSTVFLGIGYGDPPLLFETMIFGGGLNESQERYTTREAALEGHRRWVQYLRSGARPLWMHAPSLN